MQFWGYNTSIMGDGSIKAIKDMNRSDFSLIREPKQDIMTENKLEKINLQINQKQETIKDLILRMGLIYFYSLFEAFNKDYFQELYIFKPDLMKSKEKKVDLEYLLEFKNVEDLHKSLSYKQIEIFGYLDIDMLAGLILKKFKIILKNDLECWQSLRESYFRRNCIVHNDGKASEIYLKKLSLDDDRLNENLKCDIGYVWKCHHDIRTYIDFIDRSIREKFNLKDSFG